MNKIKLRHRIFTKVFLYTLTFLAVTIIVTALIFARQFISFYDSSQVSQINFVFEPFIELMNDIGEDDIVLAAEEFHDKNQSFSFLVETIDGEVLFKTPSFDADAVGRHFPGTVSETRAVSKTGTVSETGTGRETGTVSETRAVLETGTRREPGTGQGAGEGRETGTVSETGTGRETGTVSETRAVLETGDVTGAVSVLETGTVTEPETGQVTEPGTASEKDTRAVLETGPMAEPGQPNVQRFRRQENVAYVRAADLKDIDDIDSRAGQWYTFGAGGMRSDLEGLDTSLYIMSLAHPGIRLRVVQPTMDSEQFSSLISRIVLAASIILAVCVAGAILFARGITNPIKRLQSDAGKMANLELVPAPKLRSDEVGQLTFDVHRMYEKLKTTISELEDEIRLEREMEETQRYFFSAASHELKTPIAAASALLEGMIAGFGDYRDHHKYLRECLNMMKGQGRIISEILEIVQLSGGRRVLNIQPVNLSDTIGCMMNEFWILADGKGQTVTVDIPEDVVCLTDEVMFRRALSNIVMNAVQNSPDGGEVRIWTEAGLEIEEELEGKEEELEGKEEELAGKEEELAGKGEELASKEEKLAGKEKKERDGAAFEDEVVEEAVPEEEAVAEGRPTAEEEAVAEGRPTAEGEVATEGEAIVEGAAFENEVVEEEVPEEEAVAEGRATAEGEAAAEGETIVEGASESAASESAAVEEIIRLNILNTDAHIDDADIEKLFEPFYRVDKVRSRSAGRSGLGLAIVDRIFNTLEIPFILENRGPDVVFRMYLKR